MTADSPPELPEYVREAIERARSKAEICGRAASARAVSRSEQESSSAFSALEAAIHRYAEEREKKHCGCTLNESGDVTSECNTHWLLREDRDILLTTAAAAAAAKEPAR